MGRQNEAWINTRFYRQGRTTRVTIELVHPDQVAEFNEHGLQAIYITPESEAKRHFEDAGVEWPRINV